MSKVKIKDFPRTKLSPKARAFLDRMEALGWGNVEVEKDGNAISIKTAGLPAATREAIKNDAASVRKGQPAPVQTQSPTGSLVAAAKTSMAPALSPAQRMSGSPGIGYTGPVTSALSPAGGYATAQADRPELSFGGLGIQSQNTPSDAGRFTGPGVNQNFPGVSLPAAPAGGYAPAVAPTDPAIAERFAPDVDPSQFPSLTKTQAPALAAPDPERFAPALTEPNNVIPPDRLSSWLSPAMQAALPPSVAPAQEQPNAPVDAPVNPAPAYETQPVEVNNTYPVAQPAPEEAAPAMQASYPEPSLAPSDIYGGVVGTAAAGDGSFVSRDDYGTTSVTNQFGATTGMTPGGYQTAYGQQRGTPAFGPTGKLSGGLVKAAKALVGLDPNRSLAAQKNEYTGKLVGAAIGAALADIPGAIGGGYLGAKYGAKKDFPDKPTGGVTRNGRELTRSERASLSPAADRSMASNGGRTTGLW